MKEFDDFIGVTGLNSDDEEFKEAQEEASKLRETYAEKGPEDPFQDYDEEGFEGEEFEEDIENSESSPEKVTDDKLFGEEDFEVIQESGDGDGKFWKVEENFDIENEETGPKKI